MAVFFTEFFGNCGGRMKRRLVCLKQENARLDMADFDAGNSLLF
jgi:hypothetical protein